MSQSAVMLTVDVERDWGSGGLRGVREVLPRFLEHLHRHGATATFFTVGELAPVLREHVDPDGPHEVASHGLTHARLTTLSRRRLAEEVEGSKRALEAVGYTVDGFRSPFFLAPRGLPQILARCGYRYDASLGSVLPSFQNGARAGDWPTDPPIARLGTSSLRGGFTPFNLTWLRLLHPIGRRLVPARPRQFTCHLHELLDTDGGLPALPAPLRRIHARHCGARAWRLFEGLLERFGPRFVSCRHWLEGAPSNAT